MKGPQKWQESTIGRILTHESQHPRPHLSRRFIGKCHGQHLRRIKLPLRENVGNAMRQGLGLAATGPCQHQHRPVDGGDGQALGLIEIDK